MKKLVLVTAVCLLLAGCGDDKDPGNPIEDAMRGKTPAGMPSGMPTGMPPGMPGGLPAGVPGPDMLTKEATVKLTDDMMERYVAAIKELGSTDGMPSAALLTRHKFAMPQWLAINQIIGASYARTGMSAARPAMEKRLAELKKQLASADATQKPMVEMQIQVIESQLKAMPAVAEANDVDKHNMAVIERWKDRIQKAGGR